MRTITLGGMTVHVALPEAPATAVVWTHMDAEDAAQVMQRLQTPCALLAVEVEDWNRELSPWPAEGVFRQGGSFTGGAAEHLQRLLAVLPEAEALLPFAVERRALAGYSLAGLFALWAGTQTVAFPYLGSFSGSTWFDGYTDYAAARPFLCAGTRLALSLGDGEKKTRNPRMARVEDCTRQLAAAWGARYAVDFRMERGGHFDDVAGRTARGIDRLLGME